MARTAAAIWASIGAFGLLGTLEPLRTPEADVETMRVVAGVAGICRRRSLHRARASDPAMGLRGDARRHDRGHRMRFRSWAVPTGATSRSCSPSSSSSRPTSSRRRISLAHLALIAALLTSRLFFVDGDDATRVETIRFTILLPALVSVWALVTLLRKNLADREFRLRAQEIYDLETGALGRKRVRPDAGRRACALRPACTPAGGRGARGLGAGIRQRR